MCGVRYVWDMCGVRYANNLLKNPATKRLSGKKCVKLMDHKRNWCEKWWLMMVLPDCLFLYWSYTCLYYLTTLEFEYAAIRILLGPIFSKQYGTSQAFEYSGRHVGLVVQTPQKKHLRYEFWLMRKISKVFLFQSTGIIIFSSSNQRKHGNTVMLGFWEDSFSTWMSLRLGLGKAFPKWKIYVMS